jgi:hypothetical protein
MKWLGTKKIALKSIILPGNFSATKAAPRITELATSIREHGTIEPPVVEATTRKLVVGHDRIAALMSLKEKFIEARLVEGTATELRRMQIAENLHRRQDDRTSLIAEYARAEEREIAPLTQEAVETHVHTASRVKQGVKKEANAVVAAAAGVSVAAVKKAKQRVKQREAEKVAAEAPAPAAPEVELPPGFQAYGLAVPAIERGAIDETLTWLKGLELSARQAVSAMTDAEKHRQFAISPAHIQSIRVAAQTLGHVLREAMPAGLCPYCKDQPALMDACNGCGGVGVVGRHAGDHVPRELLGTDPVMVAVDGQIVSLADASAAAAKPKKKGGKAIHVEVVDEVGAAPRELTLDRSVAEESEELF